MKKLFIVLVALMLYGCSVSSATQARNQATADMRQAQVLAQASIQVPQLSYFQERKTVAKWASHWDRPSAACYVYLVSFGNIIGYYVSDGKPASTRSYITPQEDTKFSSNGGYTVIEAPDIDGCYGENNQGIRFFTASGIAVEWAGDGASYLYSDAPLKLNVPLLGD